MLKIFLLTRFKPSPSVPTQRFPPRSTQSESTKSDDNPCALEICRQLPSGSYQKTPAPSVPTIKLPFGSSHAEVTRELPHGYGPKSFSSRMESHFCTRPSINRQVPPRVPARIKTGLCAAML